jgi:L-asparagine oxygenase
MSFGDAAQGTFSAPLAILSGPENAPQFVADFHAMKPLSDTGQDAMAELEAALLSSLRGVVLDVGDMIVIDNGAAVHGRTRYSAHYDGADRWLRRCFAVADLTPSRWARRPGSRVCAPLAVISGGLGQQ